jgi:hypothetical protein
MHEDAELLATLWQSVKPYIPKKEVVEAAGVFIRTLGDYADEESIIDDLRGHDNALDAVINEIYGAMEDVTSEEDDDEELDFDNLDYDYDEE